MRRWQIWIRPTSIYVVERAFVEGVYTPFKSLVALKKCPFCNSNGSKTNEGLFKEMMKRVEANDAGAIFGLGCYYSQGSNGLRQDRAKAMELWTQAVKLGYKKAHYNLAYIYNEGGSTWSPRLWQETKWQGTTLDAWSSIQVIRSEL
jgi:TPR repeat protein